MTPQEESYVMRISKKILRIDVKIQECLGNSLLPEMEKSIQHSDLQIHYCYLRQRQSAVSGDLDEERRWCALAECWEGRKKVAVAAREKDLLPKILSKLDRNSDLNRDLQKLQ